MSPCRNLRKMSRGGYRNDTRPHLTSVFCDSHSPSASSGIHNLHMSQRLELRVLARPPRRSPRIYATVLCCLLAILFFPRFLAAAEWSVEPAITLGLGADDNPALTTGPSETSSLIYISPRINWSKKTEISAVNLGLLLNATKYAGSQVEDTDSQTLSLSSFFQTTERTKWGLEGSLRRDTLFQSIQTTPGTGDLRDTDIALVEQKVRREWLSARPSWNYALSERSSLGLSYGITDVSFSNTLGTDLVDYKDHFLSAVYSRRITGQDDLNLVVNRFAYRPAEKGTKSDTTQLLAGISHAYSETSRGRFLVGSGKTRETATSGTEDTSSFVLEAGMVLRSELTTFEGVISRDVQASGIGHSVLSNQLRMYLTRKISPMLEVVVRANLLRNKVLEGSDPDTDRRYYELVPGLSWQWKPEWSIGAEYHHQRQKFDADAETAKSNALFISATYTWPRQVASR